MKRLSKLFDLLFRGLPHLLIIFSLMLLVFVVIDYFNSAMNFINNSMTKTLMFVTGVIAITSAVLLIIRQRRDLPSPDTREQTSENGVSDRPDEEDPS